MKNSNLSLEASKNEYLLTTNECKCLNLRFNEYLNDKCLFGKAVVYSAPVTIALYHWRQQRVNFSYQRPFLRQI